MLRKDLKDYSENIFEELQNKFAIVTAGDKTSGFNALTASWGGIGVLWSKKVAFVFIKKNRYTHQFTEKSLAITLSFLPDRYAKAKEIMGTTSGKDVDKWKLSGLHLTYDPDFDGAYVTEADYVFKTKKIYAIDLAVESLPEEIKKRYYQTEPEHTMYVCEIKQFLVKEDADEIH